MYEIIILSCKIILACNLGFLGLFPTAGEFGLGRKTTFGEAAGPPRRERGLTHHVPKGLYTGPYFAPGLVSNYTAAVGDTVHLSCQVLQVRKNMVS